MSVTSEQVTAPIALSERAAEEIKGLLESQGIAEAALRVYVAGGGCSGLQYGMTLVEEPEEGDKVFEQHGVRVVIDEVSLPYLDGATVDFVAEPAPGGFKIDNPNAAASCGCGSSFSTEEGGGGGGCGGCRGSM